MNSAGSSYYRARYYDPTLGRFLNEDPLQFESDDINFYAYAANDPNVFEDPDGLQPRRKYDCSLFGGCSKKPFGPPGSVKPGCPCKKEAARLPDYVSGSFSSNLPWTGGWGSWTLSTAVDRFGNVYFSPFGPGVGRSWGLPSMTLTPNYVLQKCKPDESQMSDLLTGQGISGAAGYYGGLTASCTKTGGCSAGAGLVTPQIGGNYSYSFKIWKFDIKW